MALRRIILTLTTGAALAISVSPAATAGVDPVDPEAAAILATAPAGKPVTVVTTTQTADGPRFETTVADSRAEALKAISSALDEPAASVDISHPVSIATTAQGTRRSNDSQRDRQWALNRLGAEKVWRKSRGKGIVVAVIDTGVQAGHPDLKGRVLKGRDYVQDDRSASDLNGHGTHVAGIIAANENNKRGIAGLAPSAKILPVRVLNSAGNGNTLAVARGIRWAVNQDADVINLSLAGDQPDGHVEAAVRYAAKRNVVVVAAAGNRGCAGPTSYPAAYPGVIAVGAINRNGGVEPYSNCGPYVDLVAPGTNIRSTMIRRPSLSLPCSRGKDYCMISGTSMASPYVAAAAAIVLARTRHKLGPIRVARLLTSRADDAAAPGFDNAAGNGILNVNRSLFGY